MAVWNRDLIVQKIDKVLGDTKQILAALSGGTGAVKSVQRGVCHLSGISQDDGGIFKREIKINSINPEKAMVIINSGRDDVSAFLTNLTSDTLYIGTEAYISSSHTKNISWQVIEFY